MFCQCKVAARLSTLLSQHTFNFRPVKSEQRSKDTCPFFMDKDSKTIEEQLNNDFNSLCEWFIDNKPSIHFGKEKTKSILFNWN